MAPKSSMRWHVVSEACLICLCVSIAYASNDDRLKTVLGLQFLHVVTLLLCAMKHEDSEEELLEHIRTYSIFCILADILCVGFIVAGAAVHINDQTPVMWILRALYIFVLFFCICTSIWHIRSLRVKRSRTPQNVVPTVPKTSFRPTLQTTSNNALRIRIPALKLRGL